MCGTGAVPNEQLIQKLAHTRPAPCPEAVLANREAFRSYPARRFNAADAGVVTVITFI